MCSTRNRRAITKIVAVACAALASGIVGCQRIVPSSVTRLNNTPLIVDEAMQRRDWDRTVAYYGNGDTVAGGTGYLWQIHETVPPEYDRLADVPVAAANIVCLPVGVFINEPWRKQDYQGEMIPPTYNAQPPLP